MSRHETPGDIIASLTRRHSQDGYVSHSELCRAYETVISRLCADLEVYRGTALTPQPGCVLHRTTWGAAPVLVELSLPDTEPSDYGVTLDPDWTPDVVGVLVNGHMVRVSGESVVPLEVQERWADEWRCETDEGYAWRRQAEQRARDLWHARALA